MATKANVKPKTDTIELTEVESIAYEALTKEQAALQQKAFELQSRLVRVSQGVFGTRDIEFSTVQNPVLSDDKKTITYEVVPAPKKENTQDKE